MKKSYFPKQKEAVAFYSFVSFFPVCLTGRQRFSYLLFSVICSSLLFLLQGVKKIWLHMNTELEEGRAFHNLFR